MSSICVREHDRTNPLYISIPWASGLEPWHPTPWFKRSPRLPKRNIQLALAAATMAKTREAFACSASRMGFWQG